MLLHYPIRQEIFPAYIILLKNYGFGLDHPMPAGIAWKPDIAIKNIHVVKLNGAVKAGSPQAPKNFCNAGITNDTHTVANTAIMND